MAENGEICSIAITTAHDVRFQRYEALTGNSV